MISIVSIGNIVESDSAEHESKEATYTKMREGEFQGEIPQTDRTGRYWQGDNFKKTPDPVEDAEKESEF